MRIFCLLLSLLFSLGAPIASFAASDDGQDCSGCRDHPLIARYPGAVLLGADQVAFEAAVLPLGPAMRNEDDEPVALKSLTLTGKRTRLYYMPPKERSALEVFANYREALDKAGMTTLWSCSEEACGKQFLDQSVQTMRLDLENTLEARIGFSDAERPRYLLAELKRAQGDVHVAVLAADLSTRQRAGVYVLIVESKPMDMGLVTLDSATLDHNVLSTGKAVVYGIHFDFDKAAIKPESKPQLDEIAKLLKQEPDLRLKITGHTDNQGEAAYNRQLSRRRAQAIVAALVADHGIAADRLSADGMGADAPIAGNDTEEGRASNRRVELLRQ